MPAETVRVPIQTPMFDESGNLTRTWVLFFERLFRGGDSYTVTWGVGIGANVAVGTDVAPHYLVPREGTAVKATATAKTWPEGGDVRIDILAKRPGKRAASIFGERKLVISADHTDDVERPLSYGLAEGDLLTLDVLSAGASVPGKDITVQLTIET